MNKLRIIARVLDYLFCLGALIFSGFALKNIFILFFLIPVIFFPVEFIFIYLFKTTPGKWLMGLYYSQRLTLIEGLELSFKKNILSIPLFFPPLNIFFAIFYLKEPIMNKEKRWGLSNGITIMKRQRSWLKKILIALGCVILIASVSNISIKDSVRSLKKNHSTDNNSPEIRKLTPEIKDVDYNFSLTFPNSPTLKKKKVFVKEKNKTLDAHEYICDSDANYSINSTKIPSLWTLAGTQYLFDSSIKKIKELQGDIIDQRITKYKTYPAMNYLLKNKEGGQTKGVMIINKNILHKIEITSKKELTDKQLENANKFISSFSVI